MPSSDLWTEDAIRALGTFTTLRTAARIFGISQATAYRLAADDNFPIPVIKVGTSWRVPVAAILAAANLSADENPPRLDQSPESSADQHPMWIAYPQPTHTESASAHDR